MKINIKIVSVVLVMALATLFNACDFLDEKLPNQYDVEGYYKNDTEAVKALYGTYAAVKSAVFGYDFLSVTDAMCDDMDFNGTDQARRALSSLDFDIRNKYFVNVWAKLYNVIGNANLIINKVPLMETPTETSELNQEKILAEAKFLRAWAYFMLVQLWGDVPKVTEPTYSIREDIRPLRMPADEIYAFILEDLDAAEVLGDTPHSVLIRENTDITYPLTLTRGAVRLLKAKVYLAQKKYTQCLEAVEYLIDRYDENGSRLYKLTDYDKLFNVNYKRDADRLKEVIWEIEALPVTGYNNTAHREFAPKNKIPSIATSGYLNYVPSTSLFEAFSKQSNDKRYSANYRISDGKPCILKRVDIVSTDQNTAAPNEVLLRVADAILVYAEALNSTEVGRTAEAITWINKVRDRAGLIKQVGPVTFGNIKANTPQSVVQDTILFERRLEFAHECQRLFDLRRTGKLMSAIGAYNKQQNQYMTVKSMNFPATKEITGTSATSANLTVPFTEIVKNNSTRILFHPIPADEIQSNPNLKPNNGGY